MRVGVEITLWEDLGKERLAPFRHLLLDSFSPPSLRAIRKRKELFQVPAEVNAVRWAQRVGEWDGLRRMTLLTAAPAGNEDSAVSDIGYLQKVHAGLPRLHEWETFIRLTV
jgi:hypothetical protein